MSQVQKFQRLLWHKWHKDETRRSVTKISAQKLHFSERRRWLTDHEWLSWSNGRRPHRVINNGILHFSAVHPLLRTNISNHPTPWISRVSNLVSSFYPLLPWNFHINILLYWTLPLDFPAFKYEAPPIVSSPVSFFYPFPWIFHVNILFFCPLPLDFPGLNPRGTPWNFQGPQQGVYG